MIALPMGGSPSPKRGIAARIPARLARFAGAALLALSLAGCATTGTDGQGGVAGDPLEPFNRSMYSFNDTLDRAVLRPVARGYERVVPEPARDMVGNFFGNLADIWTGVNQLLQGKPAEGFSDFWRVAINTTFGFGGIADVASLMGIEKHDEDFGQTLGVWGVPSGPYLVLPFLGPSTVRDGAAWAAVDFWGDPVVELTSSHGRRNNAYVLRTIDRRARLFQAEGLLEGAALDRYSFMRDAWLQRRRNQVYDGNPPPLDDDCAYCDEYLDEEDDAGAQATGDRAGDAASPPVNERP